MEREALTQTLRSAIHDSLVTDTQRAKQRAEIDDAFQAAQDAIDSYFPEGGLRRESIWRGEFWEIVGRKPSSGRFTLLTVRTGGGYPVVLENDRLRIRCENRHALEIGLAEILGSDGSAEIYRSVISWMDSHEQYRRPQVEDPIGGPAETD